MVAAWPAEIAWTTVRDNEPTSSGWLHSGIALLDDGRVAFGSVGGGSVVLLDEESGAETVVELPTAHPHGITAQGARLWIADPGPDGGVGQVLEVSLAGEVLSRLTAPILDGTAVPWRPTSVAVVDGTAWVADGYGESRLYGFDPEGGVRVVESAGGVRFDCPHGLTLDYRSGTPRLVVADRGNRRLVYLSIGGAIDRIVADDIMLAPSCLAVRGDLLTVTDLAGTLLTVDLDDRVSILAGDSAEALRRPGWPNRIVGGESVPPVLRDRELNSPHGVAVSASGAVYLTEWLLGGRVVRLDWRA